ncbi:DUF302 domain-containing protein [Candidatus Uabimicrobium sp. HlEnr_7]|uniref:DUF302 domain-containing protein n=1 Tax=Candidatus Uabimicrobium helgolandensis TaxID=3095367 RepID=UPI003556E6B3
MLKHTIIIAFMFFVSCNSEKANPINNSSLAYSQAKKSSKETYSELIKILKSKKPIGIIAEVNHSENAQKANIDLDYTRVVLFGNPKLGTPIMQKNLQAGLDLPQKMLVFSRSQQATVVYNSTDYIVKRHGVSGVESLSKMSKALEAIATKITGKKPQLRSGQIKINEGIITKHSKNNVDTTYNKIKTIIENNPALGVMAELDHQANAARVNLQLPPCRLIVFGNPKLGTPLMLEGQTIAIDLPQKMLVYENKEGKVVIAYNSPSYLALRHGIVNNDIIKKITKALDTISNKACE